MPKQPQHHQMPVTTPTSMRSVSKLLSKSFPVIGAVIIAKYALKHRDTILGSSSLSFCVRITYTVLLAITMEYVSRYNHCYLFHGKYLWWIHGSHHHQYPPMGSKPIYEHNNPYVSPSIEFNDAFAIFFATIATLLIWIGWIEYGPLSTLAKDCSTGIGLGVTLYGFSYFVGHDIVAHERLGKVVASTLRRAFPYLDECSKVHVQYHHKLTKRSDDSDPYGAPYGFWMGPWEIECLKKGQSYVPMPKALKSVTWVAIMIFFTLAIQSTLPPVAQGLLLLGSAMWLYDSVTLEVSTKTRRIGKLLALNWQSTPSRLMPHGMSGVISVGTGLCLIFGHSLIGNLNPYILQRSKEGNINLPYLVILYASTTLWNAIGGIRIVTSAPSNARSTFRICAVLQICLSYFIIRFLPHTSALLLSLESHVFRTALQYLDSIVTATSVICTLAFFGAVIDISKQSIVLGQSIAFGIFGILLLSVYPIQLSIQGEEWWECIQSRYQMQASGMVAFIYIPATVTFSLILFGATLYLRKIISATEYGVASLVVIFVCLLSTVLSQEMHIPYVSTQRIYLPCEDPVTNSFEGRMLEALDFSRYARSVLSTVFGVEFEPSSANE